MAKKKAVNTQAESSQPKAEVSYQMMLEETTLLVPLGMIVPNPYQPEGRLTFPLELVEKMSDSILLHGLLQHPLVRVKKAGVAQGD